MASAPSVGDGANLGNVPAPLAVFEGLTAAEQEQEMLRAAEVQRGLAEWAQERIRSTNSLGRPVATAAKSCPRPGTRAAEPPQRKRLSTAVADFVQQRPTKTRRRAQAAASTAVAESVQQRSVGTRRSGQAAASTAVAESAQQRNVGTRRNAQATAGASVAELPQQRPVESRCSAHAAAAEASLEAAFLMVPGVEESQQSRADKDHRLLRDVVGWLLRAIYARHAPWKQAQVPALLDKYRRDELSVLVAALCKHLPQPGQGDGFARAQTVVAYGELLLGLLRHYGVHPSKLAGASPNRDAGLLDLFMVRLFRVLGELRS